MPPANTEPPLLDPTAIESLRKVAGDQGPSFVAEMAHLFEEEAVKALEELRNGCDRCDWKLVTRVAHSLKSSAATLGLMRLSLASQALEMDTRGGAASAETAALVEAVLDQFNQATPVLKTLT
jgi:HPt (histidine-containing phosphotransfer) domain-containing protein